MVFQDFKLISASIGLNIAVTVNFDNNQVKECLKEAGVAGRIAEKGLDTCLYKNFEEDGIEISDGEAQKIALL